MTTRINFTKKNIDDLAPPPGQARVDVYDTTQRNLFLLVAKGGSKTFYVRKKTNGKSERIQIGRYPEMSIEQARNRALSLLSKFADGTNPAEEKRISDLTVYEAFENYIDGYARHRCKRVVEMHKDFGRYYTRWRDTKIGSLRRFDVQVMMNDIAEKNGPCAANHALVLMRAAINWNIRQGLYNAENPWTFVRQWC